ncbi:cytoplasmic dynein 2 intermediate chain 1-like isoform X2 [Antedon mediterranea]|uniref:cytoplasmic dynein 2 intermediate chain 1-like isoform X2 n=1 Tax=Antedon mediterranea TaxID=105859 RepID=UPI003AF70907
MPSERRKKLVDTWGEDELKNSMKETRKERSKESRSKQDGERDDHDRRKRRDEKGGSRGKDRHETTRDNENRREHSGKERDIKDRRKPKDDDDEERRRRNERRKEEERTKSGNPSDDRKKKEDKERSKHADNEDEVGTSDRKKERRHRDETEEERRKRKEKEREKRHRDREAVENGSSDKGKRRSERRNKNHEEGSSRDREERKRDERKRKDEQEKHENTDEKHRRLKENEDDREPSKNKEDKDKNKDRRRYERKEKDIGENGSRERDERKRDEKHRRREHEDDKERKKNKEEREHSDTNRKRKENIECKEVSRIGENSDDHEIFGQTFIIQQSPDDIKVEKETEKKTENSKATNNHVDKDNYEDDDFEDYDDDDFEDEDNDDSEKTTATSSEYDDLRRAIAEENEASLRRSLEPSVSSSPSSRPTTSRSSGRTFVNFVAAKQRQISDKVSQKTRKRGQELMALLDLDAVGFDVLDMAPVNEYDLYIRSFGQSNTKQAYAQCNEDNLEREIQTDDIEMETKWTQHPANDSKGCGGETLNEDERSIFKGEDSMRLAHFLEKASRVVCTLLEEEEAANHLSSLQSSNFCFSQGFTHLNMQHPFLEGRDVLQVQFHPVQTSLLLTAHTLPRLSNLKHNLNGAGLICLWNLNIPNKPQRVLSCQSSITCCCFSPTKTSSVFAGTVDGSVVAWDLREPSTMHSTFHLSTKASIVDIQPPTYSTDGISNEDNHHSTVVSIQPVVSITDSVQSTKDEGVAFQLASMEQRGQVVFWVVIEVDKVDIAGSQSDLGLVPGGKIKLMKSSSICLKDPRRDVSHLSVRHLHFSQTDANHFYVATDAGYIMHCTRNGTADMPRLYHTQIDFPVDILAVDFHPFGLPFFLVGCRDGCIRLHHTKSEFPVVTWSNSTNGMDLVSLAWSRSRPAVFFSVDVTAKMFIWDLLKSDSNPIRTEQFNNKRLKCLSLSNDHSATRRARSEREPELAVSNEKGTVEIHRLNEQFSRAEQDELTQCKEFLQALM